jgi:hypothetical protein
VSGLTGDFALLLSFVVACSLDSNITFEDEELNNIVDVSQSYDS